MVLVNFIGKPTPIQRNLPRPIPELENEPISAPEQVLNVQQQMRVGHPLPSSVQIPKTLIQDLNALAGGGSSHQTEEALRCLGQYLGLESTRPDKEFKTGPDVLWIGENGCAVCIEVKSDKGETSNYRKEEVGQLHDHVQWVKDNYQASEIIPVFVGRLLPVSDSANPSPDMKVVELQRFQEVGQNLVSALQDVANRAMPSALEMS